MLQMITNSTMNSLLNSVATPPNLCVTKHSALQNGTNEDYMDQFETFNNQQFPLNRLIPVWPVQQSHVETVCVAPYDSRNVRIPISKGGTETLWPDAQNYCFNRDSYIAGFRYTFDIPSEARSWLNVERNNSMITDINLSIGEYPLDMGAYFYADLLPSGVTRRTAYVIVHAEPETTILYPNTNVSIYEYLYGANGDGVGGVSGPAPNICDSARLFIRQEDSGSGDIVATYTNITSLQLGFPPGPDSTQTYPNIAVVPEDVSSGLSGFYYTSGEMIDPDGTHGPGSNYDYTNLVTCNRNTITFDFTKQPTDKGPLNITYDIYASWEGYDQNSPHPIPLPLRRRSWSVDICPNQDMTVSKSVTITAQGNMNINRTGVIDLDTSNVLDKLRSRCSLIASVVYNDVDNTVTIFRGGSAGRGVINGISPIFYPTTYQPDGESAGTFVWMGTAGSVNRNYQAVAVGNKVVTVNVNSKQITNVGSGSQEATSFYVYMDSDTAGSSYKINGTTVTSPNDKVTVSSGQFTIDFTGDYESNSTHRFVLQQIIPTTDQVPASGNKSPEYAKIAFTIN